MTKRYLTAALGAATGDRGTDRHGGPGQRRMHGPAGLPMAQMCDSPVDADGMWERCLTTYPGGPLNPATRLQHHERR